jgi:hypothetical protein
VESFHRVDVGSFTVISDVHVTSIFRVEVDSMGECLCVGFNVTDTRGEEWYS